MPHRVFGSTLCLCSLDVSSTSFPKMRLDISKSPVSNVDWCYVMLMLSFTKYCQIVLQIGCTNLIRSVHECLALPIIWFCYCCKCFHCDIAPNIFFYSLHYIDYSWEYASFYMSIRTLGFLFCRCCLLTKEQRIFFML